jgi:hypothetical protein
MSDLVKPSNWTEEETQNVVNVFAWLLKEDKKQNPHLYKKMKIPPKSLGNVPDKEVSIMSENS